MISIGHGAKLTVSRRGAVAPRAGAVAHCMLRSSRRATPCPVHADSENLPTHGVAIRLRQRRPSLPAAPTLAKRPRIGLVLSGGGARGAAHIGVLKMLDRLHVPIDAIAGTSMGAVVGGLYASGMSGQQIEQAMASVDWQVGVPRSAAARRAGLSAQGGRPEHYLVNLPLGLQGRKLVIPKGLMQGQKLTETLRQLTLPVGTHHRFRSVADAISRRGDRPGDRRAGGARRWRSDHRDARQHVRARGICAGRLPRAAAGRRRSGREPADRRGARDGCRRADRGRCRLSAAAAQEPGVVAGHHQPGAGSILLRRDIPAATQIAVCRRHRRQSRAGRFFLVRFRGHAEDRQCRRSVPPMS